MFKQFLTSFVWYCRSPDLHPNFVRAERYGSAAKSETLSLILLGLNYILRKGIK